MIFFFFFSHKTYLTEEIVNCIFLFEFEYKLFTGGRYFHFLADPFSFQAVARESKSLCFRKFSVKPLKKLFDIDHGPKTENNSVSLRKNLQVKEYICLSFCVLSF